MYRLSRGKPITFVILLCAVYGVAFSAPWFAPLLCFDKEPHLTVVLHSDSFYEGETLPLSRVFTTKPGNLYLSLLNDEGGPLEGWSSRTVFLEENQWTTISVLEAFHDLTSKRFYLHFRLIFPDDETPEENHLMPVWYNPSTARHDLLFEWSDLPGRPWYLDGQRKGVPEEKDLSLSIPEGTFTLSLSGGQGIHHLSGVALNQQPQVFRIPPVGQLTFTIHKGSEPLPEGLTIRVMSMEPMIHSFQWVGMERTLLTGSLDSEGNVCATVHPTLHRNPSPIHKIELTRNDEVIHRSYILLDHYETPELQQQLASMTLWSDGYGSISDSEWFVKTIEEKDAEGMPRDAWGTFTTMIYTFVGESTDFGILSTPDPHTEMDDPLYENRPIRWTIRSPEDDVQIYFDRVWIGTAPLALYTFLDTAFLLGAVNQDGEREEYFFDGEELIFLLQQSEDPSSMDWVFFGED